MPIIQIYSGITRGRVLNGDLYAQRLQKLIYLVLFYKLFYEAFSPILETILKQISSKDWREIFTKQSVNKFR